MRACLIALFALSLSACASTSEKSSMSEKNMASQSTIENHNSDIDWDYVDRVERASRLRGVVVQWVNMPLKKRTETTKNP